MFEPSTRLLRGAAAISALVLGSTACSSGSGAPSGMPSPGPGATSSGTPTSGPTASVPVLDPSNPANPEGPVEYLGHQSRLARLTHQQWENSVRDLFQLEASAAFADSFRADPRLPDFLFDNNALSLLVDDALWVGYQQAAAKVAELVTSDPAKLAATLPPADVGYLPFWDANQVRAEEFIKVIGARAFRRPLTEAEVDRYMTLHNNAGGFYEGVSDFESGVRLVIEGLLLSPYFIYRVERSAAKQGALIPLDAYEVAARLSYAIWNTLPDPALQAAAAAGQTTTEAGAQAQAARLLVDPRARPVLVGFNSAIFDTARYSSINPAAATLGTLAPSLAADALREHQLVVENAFFTSEGGLGHLLTSNDTWVNANLAAVYGLPAPGGADFVQVQLSATERRGILSQVGFLALNATSTNPDPIHRGVFVSERLLCKQIASPPGDIPPLPAPGDMTNRERVEAHTEAPGSACQSCHASLINPFGFPFEIYDAVGRYRTMDNAKPVNPASTVEMDGAQVAVTNALELAEALAASPSAHRCFAKHLVEFTFGRPYHELDAGLVERLATASSTSGMGTKQMFQSIVTSQSFLNRSAEELP
jgi:hypothetical protein